MSKQQSQSNVRERVDLREPHRWQVIFWNDDFTTMDFVVMILTEVFHKSEKESEAIMLEVHKKGSAIVGAYSYDIAISRTERATEMARKEGFPLKITYRKE